MTSHSQIHHLLLFSILLMTADISVESSQEHLDAISDFFAALGPDEVNYMIQLFDHSPEVANNTILF